MAYLRFAINALHEDSGVSEGIFPSAYALWRSGQLPAWEADQLDALLDWFGDELPVPTSFRRGSSSTTYRKLPKGISWIRDSARDHIDRLRELARLLGRHGCPVKVIVEERIGYIIYEDEFQVVAEPFRETRT